MERTGGGELNNSRDVWYGVNMVSDLVVLYHIYLCLCFYYLPRHRSVKSIFLQLLSFSYFPSATHVRPCRGVGHMRVILLKERKENKPYASSFLSFHLLFSPSFFRPPPNTAVITLGTLFDFKPQCYCFEAKTVPKVLLTILLSFRALISKEW